MFTDSHCHLAMTGGKADAELARAREAGVRGFVVPGTKLDDCPEVVEIASRHGDVWAAVGFHPHEAKDFDAHAEETIRTLAGRPRVVAIGEIGLDYHYDHSPRDRQRDAFAAQIGIARERDLPVIVHNRESTNDLLELLERRENDGVRTILHSFTETYDVAKRLLDRGAFLSFSGIITFRSAEPLREVAKRLPRDRVLIETDTPYLAPVPHRGKENEPAYVVRVAELLGSLWGKTAAEAGAITSANFEKAFGVSLG